MEEEPGENDITKAKERNFKKKRSSEQNRL